MRNTKRGISPLIATVLIIGFTIVLAALVIQWGGGLFKGVQERTGATAELSEKCATQLTNLEIERPTKSPDEVFVTIDNKNNLDIQKFDFRLYKNDDSVETIAEASVVPSTGDMSLKRLERKKYTLSPDGGADTVNKLGIFPYVTLESTGEVLRCTKEEGPFEVSAS